MKFEKGEEPDALKKLLDVMEGFPIRYGMNVEQEHIYCDLCSEPIYPNEPATHYLSDRLVFDEDDVPNGELKMDEHGGFQIGDFFILRVSHADCEPRHIPYPCDGYLEMFLDASWGQDFGLERPTVLDLSNRSDGILWDPETCYDAAMGVESGPTVTLKKQWMVNMMALGPHDVLMFLVVKGVDPRFVIDEETGEPIAHKHKTEIREGLKEGSSLLEQWEDEGPPPAWRFPRGPDNERVTDERYDPREDDEFAESLSEDADGE